MSAPKFTDGPWAARNSNSVYGGVEIHAKDSKIAYMFHRTRDWYDALLIASAPDLYASEEKNLELLKIPYHAFQYMLALCKADVKMQTFVVDQLKVKFEDIEKFAKEYEERIAETEQLLKKARGEE